LPSVTCDLLGAKPSVNHEARVRRFGTVRWSQVKVQVMREGFAVAIRETLALAAGKADRELPKPTSPGRADWLRGRAGATAGRRRRTPATTAVRPARFHGAAIREALALTWADVDLDRTLSVERQLADDDRRNIR
jgi:hypothetical protein